MHAANNTRRSNRPRRRLADQQPRAAAVAGLQATGWRCWACHPSAHLPAAAVREVVPGAIYGVLHLAGASLIRDEVTWLKRRKSVNALLVLMVLLIWVLMNHHGLFVQAP
jgi:hypothetical protein